MTTPASKAYISGCEALSLTREERAFFGAERPWGLILFKRNCDSPSQIADLIADFRACVGRADAPVLIDQEGGRVQRLQPPHWPAYPAAADIGALYGRDQQAGLRAAFCVNRLIAHDLDALGITVDCVPVLDVPVADADKVIGNRAYGRDPQTVIALAGEAIKGIRTGGLLPVIKHMPGHGRATVDSHISLPVVTTSLDDLRATDFKPFGAFADEALAMTAHVVYAAIDPARPATLSPDVVKAVIRDEIGFDGVLMCDDLSMQALDGDLARRAAGALTAGCDLVLHCNGQLDEMKTVAEVIPELTGEAAARCDRALASRGKPEPLDPDAMRSEVRDLLAVVA